MTKRGPRRKSEDERRAAKSRGRPAGSRGKRIVTLDNLPTNPPSALNKEEAAVWRVFVRETSCIKEVKMPDLSLVIRYCKLTVRLDRLNIKLDDEGEVLTKTTTKDHEIKYKNPAWDIAIKIHDALKSIEESFGMTPLARKKADIETTDIKYVEDEPVVEVSNGVDEFGVTEDEYTDMMNGPDDDKSEQCQLKSPCT